MADGPLAFHASPPPGHWINDPNGLIHHDGAFRLFAQHRADAPAFRETGWARFSSPDLLAWTFDGAVIAPAGSEWAYSGCVAWDEDGLEAIYTAHDDRCERQVRRVSRDGGLSWSAAAELPSLGMPAPNRRDPFVFSDGADCGLLLAEPCDWTDWADAPPSRLLRYRSSDRCAWEKVGAIGPWRPPGVMWEVPLLLRIDGADVLIVSEVDRRAGGADCSVRAWIGRLTDDAFVPDGDQPGDGQLVDLGPDFYALTGGGGRGWPLAEPVFVAWLSNWTTARTMAWPGFHGGPISLPRALGVERRDGGARLTNRPATAVLDLFTRALDAVPRAGLGRLACAGDSCRILIEGERASAVIEIDGRAGTLAVERHGSAPWRTRAEVGAGGGAEVLLFLDGPVVELFLPGAGASLSMILDGAERPFRVSATVDGHATTLNWCAPRPGGERA